jgi:hypothetical protein
MQLLTRRPVKVAAVALADKTARIAWVVLARGESPPIEWGKERTRGGDAQSG